MGGTTAKTSLIKDNEVSVAQGYHIGGYASGHPVMFPVVDIVEVGAGGGSIAWIDEVGALKLGPQSAGSEPGPICYRRGGDEPAVTDANVVLGRIGAASFLGGEMPLDVEAARRGPRSDALRAAGDERDRGRARHRQDRGREDVARRARRVGRARLRSARLRARRDRRRGPAARRGDRARAADSDGDRAEPAGALLGARHADGRRAAGLRAHLLQARSSTRTTRSSRRSIAELAARRSTRRSRTRASTPQHAASSTGSICATSARSSGCRYRSRKRRSGTATARRSNGASARSTISGSASRARRAARAREPAPHGDRRAAEDRVPEATARAAEARVGDAPDSSRRCGACDGLRGLPAREADAGRRDRGPAVVEEYASTTVLFAGDRLRVADTGELIVTVRRS